jgi:hypothetical protein
MKKILLITIILASATFAKAQWQQTNGPHKSILSLAVSGTNILAGTDGRGVFLSIDNGSNWSNIGLAYSTVNVYSIAVSDSTIFAGSNNGVYKTSRGSY